MAKLLERGNQCFSCSKVKHLKMYKAFLVLSFKWVQGILCQQMQSAEIDHPAKKVAENSDAVLWSNKEQICLFEFCGHNELQESFVTDQANTIQGTPSASHLESPHMGVQAGIDLMVHTTTIIFMYLINLVANLNKKEYLQI